MSELDYEQLTLFQGDFPANLFPWLESRKEKGTTATCGQKCLELSESLRRVGSSVRTYLESCELPLPTLSRTWSVRRITWSCLILKLRLSALRTEGKESSLWPTVTTDSATNRMPKYKQGGTPLTMAVRMWPTPIASDSKPPALNRDYVQLREAVKLYPTPSASIAQGSTGGNRQCDLRDKRFARSANPNPAEVAKAEGGQLNPDWVEWLMGFPVGWTSLTECQE